MLAIDESRVNNDRMESRDLGGGNGGEINPSIRVEDVVKLGQLILKFSRVDRATLHEDGVRSETDADHTVMLAVLACSIARELRPDLDIGKVAQYALVHDLVEVYAGDTVTISISEAEKKDKRRREADAFLQITNEFGNSFPWLIETIENYESLEDIESRFVKGLDKLMPKVTHILNNGAYIRQIGMTKAGLIARYDRQNIDMSEYMYDLPEIIKLSDDMSEVFLDIMFPGSTSA